MSRYYQFIVPQTPAAIEPLVLASIDPDHGDANAETPVTIAGTGLFGISTMTIGGLPCTQIDSTISAISATALSPALPQGLYDVEISGPGGTSTLPAAYQSGIAAPTIASISPDLGDFGGGITVIIGGANLLTTTDATINGVACTAVTPLNDSQVQCVTPALPAGVYDVSVTTLGGSDTLVAGYEAFDIASLAWTSLHARGGYSVPAGVGTWIGVPSAGTSGANATNAVTPPANTGTGADVNSPIVGPNQFLEEGPGPVVSDAAATVVVMMIPQNLVPSGGPGNLLTDEASAGQTTVGGWGIAMTSDGAGAYLFDGVTYQEVAVFGGGGTISDGSPVMTTLRWDSAVLSLKFFGSGLSQQVPCTGGSGADAVGLTIGANFGGLSAEGTYRFVGCSDTAFDDATVTKIFKWGQSLGYFDP